MEELNEDALRKGKTFTFGNDLHYGEIRFAELPKRGERFILKFNGKILKSTKTFAPVQIKMLHLIEDYHLGPPRKNKKFDNTTMTELAHSVILKKLEKLIRDADSDLEEE